jgi:hypothetical protein
MEEEQLLVQLVPKVNKGQLDPQDLVGPKAQVVFLMDWEKLDRKEFKV